ncbi:hypothetical protein [Cellulomonas hominis]|uniref:hypothetical protein n=1 Tax=Cellulomonas hominis TaxID=156981 RepID=UPI001BCECA71|nr:hypothetical protein [Cellulomonas hominis]
MLVRVLVRGRRVPSRECCLGDLVFDEQSVCRRALAVAEPKEGFGHVRVRVESTPVWVTPACSEELVVQEDVTKRSIDLLGVKIGEVPGDVF